MAVSRRNRIRRIPLPLPPMLLLLLLLLLLLVSALRPPLLLVPGDLF
jgi:hypothetical protein